MRKFLVALLVLFSLVSQAQIPDGSKGEASTIHVTPQDWVGWTTANRPPGVNSRMGWNLDSLKFEYFAAGSWHSFNSGGFPAGPGTPTLQQVLTAGSTLINSFTIASSGLTGVGNVNGFLQITSDLATSTLRVDNTNSGSSVLGNNNSNAATILGFNSGPGQGLAGTSLGAGTGVIGQGFNGGVGGSFFGFGPHAVGADIGVQGSTLGFVPARPLILGLSDSDVVNVATMIDMNRNNNFGTFVGADGMGESINYNVQNSNGNGMLLGKLIMKATSALFTNEQAQYSIQLNRAHTQTTVWTLDADATVTTFAGHVRHQTEISNLVINVLNTDDIIIFYGPASVINAFPTGVNGQPFTLVNHSNGAIPMPSVSTGNGTTSVSIPAGQTYVISYDAVNALYQKIN